MLLRDALLAYAHFLAILFLTAVLCAELAVYRQELAAPIARRLQKIDLFFGIAAIVVIVTGIARVAFGLKGADFYLHNPVFWTKMGLFLLVGLLSIAPTVHYLRWNATLSAGTDAIREEPRTFARIRSLLVAEIVVLAFIPLCAALMSRGL
jgi:putative membrane protein